MEISPFIIAHYADLTDKEVVSAITNEKPDMEAAAYLLCHRYAPLLRHQYLYIFNGVDEFYDDVVASLFLYLCGDNGKWEKLAAFGWRCTFGNWLKIVASRHFIACRKELMIDADTIPVYIDGGDGEIPPAEPTTAVDVEDDDNEIKILLLEAIAQLKDVDQKLVVLKRLQGYNSKEIAILLQKMWKMRNIVRYDNKGNIIIPSAGYVDVKTQRAKKELKKILATMV